MDKRGRIVLFFLTFFGVLSFMLSCERDDICADVEITPRVIIRFTDFTDPDDFNDVVNLQIQYIPDEDEEFENGVASDSIVFNVFENAVTSDSIALPLPTSKNRARFRFIQNFELDIDDNEDLSNAEIDIVEFTYTTTEEYVNRACGFKTIYSDLEVVSMPGNGEEITQGFIQGRSNVVNKIIEDEDEAHVRFSH